MTEHLARLKSAWVAAVALSAGLAAGCGPEAPEYDLVIRGGMVVDGSGDPARPGDIAVQDGRIASIGEIRAGAGLREVDASGLYVAPGFIDVHTHADSLAEHPRAENYVRMGVTAVVAGNCGGSPVEIGEALRALGRAGGSVNFATLVGHNSVRRAVMGTESRPPTADELEEMKALVAAAMRDGAVGLSTGLEYVPGTYSETGEIVELAKVAAEHGGLYASHMRNEGMRVIEAVSEAIAVGEAARLPVQISHLKIDSPSRWGYSEQVIRLIEEARARGVDVKADQYAYPASGTGLSIRFPSWALEGGQERIVERLSDAATWTRIRREIRETFDARGFEDFGFARVANFGDDPSYNGRTIKELAQDLRGDDSWESQLEVARDMMERGGASMVYQVMSEEDIERIMRHPYVSVASDASLPQVGEGVPHPRGYGNNARVLGEYVRGRGVITVEEAVRKMTSLPAEHFGFADRGLIREGHAADLVLFDPAMVTDRATFENPHQFPDGIPHVFVNGVAVVRNGEHTGATPGQVLRRGGGE